MLKSHMLIFWGVLAIAGTSAAILAIFRIASSYAQTEQDRQNQQEPGHDNNTAGQIETKSSEQNSNYWPRIEERVQQRWNKFINNIKRDDNDKIVVAIATIAIALFTGMLFFSNIFLFISGEKSAAAAKKAAEAAKEAVMLSDKTAERQLRAYVSATAINIDIFGWKRPTAIKIALQNHGQTPAYDAYAVGIVDVLPLPIPDHYIFQRFTDEAVVQRFSIYPDKSGTISSTTFATRLFSEQEKRDIISGTSGIYAYGTVFYKDIFNQHRFTEFCASVQSPNMAALVNGAQGTYEVLFLPHKQHSKAT